MIFLCHCLPRNHFSQVLALELLKVLLENSGEVFQGSEKFTGAIKQYLCLSLLKNAASNISAAQTLACSIFYTLLVKFRHALKAEVGVFFPMILLKAIEPPARNTSSTPACESSLPAHTFVKSVHAVVVSCVAVHRLSCCQCVAHRIHCVIEYPFRNCLTLAKRPLHGTLDTCCLCSGCVAVVSTYRTPSHQLPNLRKGQLGNLSGHTFPEPGKPWRKLV